MCSALENIHQVGGAFVWRKSAEVGFVVDDLSNKVLDVSFHVPWPFFFILMKYTVSTKPYKFSFFSSAKRKPEIKYWPRKTENADKFQVRNFLALTYRFRLKM